MKYFYVTVFFLLFSCHLLAMPAYSNKIKLELNTNEYVTLFLHGDENNKWATSEDGYTLLTTSNGWVYAQEDKDGYAVPSSFYLSAKKWRSKDLEMFLSKQKKNILVHSSFKLINICNQNSINKNRTPIVGKRKALVILMAFKDLDFHKQHADFDALFNTIGYQIDGAIGSVRDYFLWASYGQLDFTCDILGPYTASNTMNYYGENIGINGQDRNPLALFKEAIKLVAEEINLADYDSDKDGYVDNIHIIFSGYGEESGASPSAIWSHEMTFDEITMQGMKINKYSCAPELRGNSGEGISRIGPHCHEMGHALGAMDYYDTDYAIGGYYEGTGDWDIMASGSWNNEGIAPANFNPYVRCYDFGWTNVQILPDNQSAILYPSNEKKDEIYRLNTSVEDEFYLIENRSKSSFDEAIPGEGLLIYHIGAGMASAAVNNEINVTYPQECYIVCASSETKVPIASVTSYGNINSDGCPFPGSSKKTLFDDYTTPSAVCQNDKLSGVSLSEITLRSDGVISLFNRIENKGEVIWRESFEEENFLSRWKNEFVQGGQWAVYNSDNDWSLSSLTSMPQPIEGKCYLYMQCKNGVENLTSKVVSRISSEILDLSPLAFYTLSLKYQINSKLYPYANFINIYSRDKITSEWHLLKKCSLSNKGWSEIKIELPTPSETYQLLFEGEIALSGSLFLDDIKITCKKEVSDGIEAIQQDSQCGMLSYKTSYHKLHVSYASANSFYIYDMLGRLHYSTVFTGGEEKEISLTPGIYILYCGIERIKIMIE